MKELFLYFWHLLEDSPTFRPVAAVLKHTKRRFEFSIQRRPAILLSCFAAVGCAILYSCSSDWKPGHECKVLEVNNEEMYAKNGDDIGLGRSRDCAKERKIVAVEFYNMSDAAVPDLKKRIPNLVSGGLLVSEPARGRGSDDQHSPKWHEYMLYKSSNNFTWAAESSPQYAFVAGTCKETTGENIDSKDLTIRSGILLKGEQPRPAKYPDPQSIAACKGASQNNNFKKSEGCVMWNLEIFIPSLEPKDLCGRRSYIDDWLNPGTKKTTFVTSDALNSLRQEAQDRWNANRAHSISTEVWNKQISNAPKLCIRWVDSDYKPLGDQTSWDEFASIAKIWCDY